MKTDESYNKANHREVASGQKKWSEREDLNLRPPQPHCGALPSCATFRYFFVSYLISDKRINTTKYKKLMQLIF